MNEQLSLFHNYKICKPIRLIELFAGVGSQAMALRDLGAEFEHYKISEWEYNANSSYKAIHCEKNNADYSLGMSREEIADALFNLGISADGKVPMGYNQIERKSEQWQRKIYNEFKQCNNIGSITKIRGADLEINDTDKYCYIMTYSFPCQDLSVAGKQAGMAKGNGTRSGLLWEVERLLNEVDNLPQVLLMENVPQVHGKKNMADFEKWIDFLESKGYSNYWQDLNAKNYGVAQNRNRCFMVSILGDYSFKFPEPIELRKVMKDYLEDEVDEKYYINNEKAQKLIQKLIDNGTLANTILTDRQTGIALTEQSVNQPKEKLQTVSRQDMTQELATCGQTETVLLKGMVDKELEPQALKIDVSSTLMSRDYKGLNNYGTNGVIECQKLNKQ